MTITDQNISAINDLAFNVRDGWGEDNDRASRLLEEASYLLRRAQWAHKVRAVLAAIDPIGEVLYEDSDPSPVHMTYGERMLSVGTYALTHYNDYLHLTLAVGPEDRQTFIDALIKNGLVDGWGGGDKEFEDAHSPYGWISIRTEAKQYPATKISH